LSVGSRLDFVTYVGQLAVPVVAFGAVASACATGSKKTLWALLAGYLGVSAGLGWDSLRWERRPDGRQLGRTERLSRALRVSVFNGLWLLVVPRALLNLVIRGGPMRYEKMEHRGAAPSAWERGTDEGASGS